MQLIYYGRHGTFTWQIIEKFNIRGFNTKVNDERYFTMKKNVKYRNKEDMNFTVETDAHGFRIGHNQIFPDGNIVFIGDSVPFGWGVDGVDCVPSILYDILMEQGRPKGIINAAIPSYSLDQAVHRYRYEIAGKFNVQTVILQIYDPVSQFVIFGKKWNVKQNWSTFDEKWLAMQQDNFLKYSASYYLYNRFFKEIKEEFDPCDKLTINRFTNSIETSLDILN